ncbi:MAG: hypothetical protein JWO80_1185 [Bryobacterales bacterium]|nr:hypothetical protein [Bryobacterales bacterium]
MKRMMNGGLSLSRRTVLRGAGVTLALPWLEAMAPGASAAPKQPIRMAVLYMPNGVNVNAWAPEGIGQDFKLSPTLEPLSEFKDSVLVLQNLWNEASKDGDGHYVKEAAILTSTRISKTLGEDLNANGISMDQVAAQRIAGKTPLPSLELGISPEATGVDLAVGYTRVYGCHIAWSSPTTPLAREINPRSVYERLFRASGPHGNSGKEDALLLDRVVGQANELRNKLGNADRRRIDEYMSILRSLEERTERASTGARGAWKPRVPLNSVASPAENPKDYAEHVKLMLDMVALAFQSDSTRVCTFMFGNAVSNVNFRWLEGVTGSHHDMSHHSNDAEKLRQYQLINKWYVAQYAYLLRKLQQAKEGEGSVLDNSMILFASALSDGNKHNPHKLPIVLAGKAGGRIATGQNLVFPEDTPAANLWMTMLNAFGAPVERFADSTGVLPGVLA